jgi:hypothetical protein
MLTLSPAVRIYLATGATDLRRSIDGLSAVVREQLALDPLFCDGPRSVARGVSERARPMDRAVVTPFRTPHMIKRLREFVGPSLSA